jgi:hypothetical protein
VISPNHDGRSIATHANVNCRIQPEKRRLAFEYNQIGYTGPCRLGMWDSSHKDFFYYRKDRQKICPPGGVLALFGGKDKAIELLGDRKAQPLEDRFRSGDPPATAALRTGVTPMRLPIQSRPSAL